MFDIITLLLELGVIDMLSHNEITRNRAKLNKKTVGI